MEAHFAAISRRHISTDLRRRQQAELEKKFQRETPVWLGVDEIKLGRFRAIFTNIGDRTLIDMLPDRYSTSIERFMASLPKPTRRSKEPD